MATLITGGAGFIGSHLTERLLVRDEEVVVLDNFDRFYDPAIKERNLERARDFDTFTEIRGDIRDREALDRLPDGIETVIHIAALAGVRPSIADPVRYYDVNEKGTATLLSWAADRAESGEPGYTVVNLGESRTVHRIPPSRCSTKRGSR